MSDETALLEEMQRYFNRLMAEQERNVMAPKTKDRLWDALRPHEIAAMYLFGERYARSGRSAVDFYERLSAPDQDLADRLAADIIRAHERSVSDG